MSVTANSGKQSLSGDDAHLRVLGYEEKFDRKIGMWSNFALGFLYLSPLVGVLSMFTQALTTAGPPAILWLVIAAGGQLLVAMVFGEIVSQFPISGGLYQWARRLWNGQYAWIMSWIYIAAVGVGCTRHPRCLRRSIGMRKKRRSNWHHVCDCAHIRILLNSSVDHETRFVQGTLRSLHGVFQGAQVVI